MNEYDILTKIKPWEPIYDFGQNKHEKVYARVCKHIIIPTINHTTHHDFIQHMYVNCQECDTEYHIKLVIN